jgi:hypothetical protein
MKEEIYQSEDIQESIRSQRLAELLRNYLSSPNRQKSLQRSIFHTFRSRVGLHSRLRKMSEERRIKTDIQRLLMCWKKLQKYVCKQRHQKKAADWIRKSRTSQWFSSWRSSVVQHRLLRSHRSLCDQTHLRDAMNSWQRWIGQMRSLRNFENGCLVSITHLKTRWIFRAWRMFVERELVSHGYDASQKVSFGGKKISPLTLALRNREMEGHRSLACAILQHQRTLFHGWRSSILHKKQVLSDQEAVLSSIVACRRINFAWRAWRSNSISRSYQRRASLARFWRRWNCDARVRVASRRMKKMADEAYFSRNVFVGIARWLRLKDRHCRLHHSLRRGRNHFISRCLTRAVLSWRHSLWKSVERKRNASTAMVFYLTNLQRRAWAGWVRWHQTGKITKERKRELVSLEMDRQMLQDRDEALTQNPFDKIGGQKEARSRSSSEDFTSSDESECDRLLAHPSVIRKKLALSLSR